MAIKSSSEASA